ncbi:TTC28 [Branchiostoma lanceolatum]|uniref:TTC28 protein n=1 Tax=Branchiostoma lanceolatum TaxID=7740 RepID=A0A8K0F0B2_BRALA|nr:TTC28 [Branchiostoma lanceolatum]
MLVDNKIIEDGNLGFLIKVLRSLGKGKLADEAEQHLALARQLGDRHQEGLAYNKLGRAHYAMGEYEAALKLDQKDLKIRQETGDKANLLTSYKNLAASYKALGKPDLAISHYQSAMAIAMETGNKTEQMDIYLSLGELHREQLHEPQASLTFYTDMLALAKDLERKDRERQAYNRLGLACEDMEDNKAALEWREKHLQMSQEDGDKTEQIVAQQNVAGSYKALGKPDLARSHYQSAMTVAMETGNKTEQIDINRDLGDLHRVQLHEPQVAQSYYTEMLALAKDMERKDRERQAYIRLGLACEDREDYEAALEWHEKHLQMSQEDGDKTKQLTAHKNVAGPYKALGKPDLARSHYQSRPPLIGLRHCGGTATANFYGTVAFLSPILICTLTDVRRICV